MCESRSLDRAPSRRTFVRVSSLAAGVGWLGACSGGVQQAPAAETSAAEVVMRPLTEARRNELSPEQIVELAKEGNRRFREGGMVSRDFLAEQQATASGQYPAAVLLTCIDSRAPAEVILNLGIGDSFNARVAGNIANPDILGSMEFATALAGARLVCVMGHTACGAIKGAIDAAELGNLTGLLSKIRPAVEATPFEGERSGRNMAFVDAVAKTNVELTVGEIRRQSPVLADLEKEGKIKIVGSMYDIGTGVVDFFV